MNCIDSLVTTTGPLLVENKIMTTPAVTKMFPADVVKKLSIEKSAQFKKCADSQKAKGARKNGMLDIMPYSQVK